MTQIGQKYEQKEANEAKKETVTQIFPLLPLLAAD
jgi:hypothetical protein